jgi:hypothetical protein
MNTELLDRRCFLVQSAAAAALPFFRSAGAAENASASVAFGMRRELFVDDFLIDRMEGAALRLHQPVPRDVVITCDAPWEGNTSAYFTLLQDDGVIRMYYRGSHSDGAKKKAPHPEFVCYAESRDGLTFTKPKLGLIEFNGSKENNIIWAGDGGTHNFAPFLDTNPACASASRYKALARGDTLVNGKKKSVLYAYHSADGVRWAKTSGTPVITEGAFDSQNIAFWDAERGEYRAYWRYFSAGYTDERGWKPSGVRAIRTATSKDFVHWSPHADLQYGDAPPEHLYTNAVRPYFRAPHLFIGFPTRFQPKTEQVEPVFMSSRDGVNFRRSAEELIPITAPQDRDGNRANYMTHGLLQLPGNDRELSVYATERYYAGNGSRVRRFTFRTDGFMSVHAPQAGTLITRPFTLEGARLVLNLISQGGCRVELQDASGKPLRGFAAADCKPVTGDFVDHVVAWEGGTLGPQIGRQVRLRFDLNEVDLFALQFQTAA